MYTVQCKKLLQSEITAHTGCNGTATETPNKFSLPKLNNIYGAFVFNTRFKILTGVKVCPLKCHKKAFILQGIQTQMTIRISIKGTKMRRNSKP
jgi:hypothetical protein